MLLTRHMEATVPASNNRTLFILKRAIGLLLLLALSATFFFSAWSKSYSENAFDNFQWTFLDLGISSTVVAGIIARLMIGMELMLGLFLLAHIYLKKFTYKAVIAILVVFIIYLLLVIMRQGNNGNCGCFGDKLAMTPLQAIVKNIVMIAVTAILMFLYPVRPYKYQEYATMLLCLVAFSAPFLTHPIYTGTAPVAAHDQVDLSPLYQYETPPAVDLRKGKHIVAFMSLTCPHCRKAAYLLQIIHREHPDLPIYLVIAGAEPFKKAFFDETHAESVPHLLYYGHTDEFTKMAGDAVPAIYWMNDGRVEYKSKYAYYQLDPSYMQAWVKGNLR